MFKLISLGAVCLGAASRILKSKIKETAAAVAVGVGLLVGSTADVLGQLSRAYPPINDVCFHKESGGLASSGYARMIVDFEYLPFTKSGQTYEIVWHGLKKIQVGRRLELTYDDVSAYGIPAVLDTSYGDFWWDAYSPWGGYGCTIYEGHWSGNSGSRTWVRDRWVGSVDFYKYQEAALVYLNSSLFPYFSLSQYYCTIYWDPTPSRLLHGYSEGYWTYLPNQSPNVNGWYYGGDPGSPRFHYRSDFSVTVRPPPRTPQNSNPRR